MTKKCCGVEMHEHNSSFNGEDIDEKTCLKCGAFEIHKKGQLDEEELENLREILN